MKSKKESIMEIKVLKEEFSVVKVDSLEQVDLNKDFTFIGKTDEELSVVCPTEVVPSQTLEREDHWRSFRIEGTLDFALVGILAKIAGLLANESISIFAVSTYNTDYILVKSVDFKSALQVLEKNDYVITE